MIRTLTPLIALLLSLLLVNCSSDPENGPTQVKAQGLCPNADGITGMYWEFAHSIPAPLSEVPVITQPGGQFIHSLQPILGFYYPQGFTAFEVTEAQTATIGVNLVRNDQQVVFRWIPNTQVVGTVPARTIIANEINGVFSHYGFSGSPDVLCSTSDSSFAGIPSQFEARLLHLGNITAQIWVHSTYAAGSTFSVISVTAAPTHEYDAQVMDTFLPINYQLYVGQDGTIVDNDNDGVPANVDPDDNDPNIP